MKSGRSKDTWNRHVGLSLEAIEEDTSTTICTYEGPGLPSQAVANKFKDIHCGTSTEVKETTKLIDADVSTPRLRLEIARATAKRIDCRRSQHDDGMGLTVRKEGAPDCPQLSLKECKERTRQSAQRMALLPTPSNIGMRSMASRDASNPRSSCGNMTQRKTSGVKVDDSVDRAGIEDIQNHIDQLEMQQLFTRVTSEAAEETADAAQKACEKLLRGVNFITEIETDLSSFASDIDSLLYKVDKEASLG